MIYLDSHLVVWLYQKEFSLISRKAIYILENNELSISPIVILELEYLYEVGRIKEHAQIIIDYLSLKVGLQTSNDDFNKVINAAINERWTRDPFDRIITAHARCNDAVLITKDIIIQNNYPKAVWS
ncbi:hypothetical protein LCGC14_2028310, partial [marine sediment metagenome]